MTKHVPYLENATETDANPAGVLASDAAERRNYIQNWIAKNQRRVAAGLGSAVFVLPLLAQAQTAEGMVNALDISGVSSAQVAADGSAQLTLTNGQIVQVNASVVQVAADGTILVTSAAAQVVAEVAASALAAGAGAGGVLGGLGGAGAAAAGVGVAAAAAAASGGGSDAVAAPPPLPIVNLGGVSGSSPQSFDQIFGAVPELQAGDRVFIQFGDEPEREVTVNEDGEITFPNDLDLSNVQGPQSVSFRVERTTTVIGEDDEGNPTSTDVVETVASGGATVNVDTIPPVIAITAVAGGDNTLNADEQTSGLVVTGTTDAENGQVVTINVLDGLDNVVATGTGVVTGGEWSVLIAAGDLADNTEYSVRATVSDAAGNVVDTPATQGFTTDFTADISINAIGDLSTADSFFDLTITGGSTGIEEGQNVTLSFAGVDYSAGAIDSAGNWSVTIGQSVLAGLRDAGVDSIAVSATAGDAAGNTGTATASVAATFTPPALTIDTPADDLTLNGTTAANDLDIVGATVPGATVTVSINGTAFPSVTADSGGAWTVTVLSADLPADGAYTITASATLNALEVAPDATVGLAIDTIAPSITINAVSADNVLNALEQGEDLVISGTASGAEDDQQVSVIFNGTTYTDDVAGGAWSVTVPAADLVGLADGASLPITADVTDAAGNAATQATATLATDFTAEITINPVTIETVNTFTGLTVTGTTTGVEENREVTLTFDGAPYTGTVAADGSWSVLVPSAVIDALDDQTEVTISAAVSDSAGNSDETAPITSTTDFSQPALAITAPADGSFINAQDVADMTDLTVSGVAVPGNPVTVTFPGIAPVSVTADNDTGVWSTTFLAADLPSVDAAYTISAESDIGGTSVTREIEVTRDTDAPALTVTTAVTEDGLVVSGTTSGDVDEVVVTIGGETFTAPASGGAWTTTVATDDLPVAAAGSAVTVGASAQDRAGNETTGSVSVTAPTVTIVAPAAGFVLGLDEFDNGFTISGTTTDVAEGASVTITSGDDPATFSVTAQVQADGSWTTTVPAAAVQGAEDQASFTLTASAPGNSYPAMATADLGVSTNIPPQITVNPVGEDGALIIDDLGATLELSGTTRGVQAGQEVSIASGGTELGTATVAADGTWTTTITTPTLVAEQVLTADFTVSNASGRSVQETFSAVGYQAGAIFVLDGARGAGTVAFDVLVDMDAVSGSVLNTVEFTVSFDPALANLDLDGFVIPSALTTDTFQTNRFNISQLGLADMDDGVFSFAGGSLRGFNNLEDEALISFRLMDVDFADVLVIRVSGDDSALFVETADELTFSGQPEPVYTTTNLGPSVAIIGTANNDTLVAQNIDTILRGRGGDDQIDMSAAGVNIVLFEGSSVANGFDTITGFTLGGALADRFSIAFETFDQDVLRGEGNEFQLIASGAVGADVGLLVFTTAVADFDNATIETALSGLTGLNAGDDMYLLIGDGTDAVLTAISFDGTDISVSTGSGTAYAQFTAIGDLSGFSAANILGFEQHLV
ncbi:beta strand repeat-containing protein [Roseinatronobacter sp. NSM]|uniref:beta strand repeat-containing protein n=1 Tax=Roseinatronobacter sp. NSM TaxID=3457785 RepID=UPI0040361138